MIPLLRHVGLLALTALSACTDAQHPIDLYLSQLRPITVAPLAGMNWPTGSQLCPLTSYQNSLPSSAPEAKRVNAFLKRKKFLGDENHWSLVVIKTASAGDDGMELLIFKRGEYDIINEPQRLGKLAGQLPAGFTLQVCVPAERARVLATRAASTHRTLIIFGTE
jgi:hypothetical protein